MGLKYSTDKLSLNDTDTRRLNKFNFDFCLDEDYSWYIRDQLKLNVRACRVDGHYDVYDKQIKCIKNNILSLVKFLGLHWNYTEKFLDKNLSKYCVFVIPAKLFNWMNQRFNNHGKTYSRMSVRGFLLVSKQKLYNLSQLGVEYQGDVELKIYNLMKLLEDCEKYNIDMFNKARVEEPRKLSDIQES